MMYILYNLKLFKKQIETEINSMAKLPGSQVLCWKMTHKNNPYQLFLIFWFSDVCKVITWYHAMQALDMILSNSTLRTNFVNKSGNETHNRIGNVIIL